MSIAQPSIKERNRAEWRQNGKVCTLCGERKPLEDYYYVATRDEYVPRCKACHNAEMRERQQTDAGRQKRNDWYAATREERLAVRDIHRQANRDKISAYKRERRSANDVERERRYYAAHREECTARRAAYHAAHRDQDNERTRQWYTTNYDKWLALYHKRRARIKGNGGSHTAAEWQAIKAAQEYRCLACGKQEPAIKLTLDHILPVSKGGTDNADNIQGLCGPCNNHKKARHIDYRPA